MCSPTHPCLHVHHSLSLILFMYKTHHSHPSAMMVETSLFFENPHRKRCAHPFLNQRGPSTFVAASQWKDDGLLHVLVAAICHCRHPMCIESRCWHPLKLTSLRGFSYMLLWTKCGTSLLIRQNLMLKSNIEAVKMPCMHR